MKIAVLTSPDQWFVPYAKAFSAEAAADLFFDHADMPAGYDAVFILSYHRIIPQSFLNRQKRNLVVHASALPQGKGWAPLFWQVLEGKNEIPFTLFEAAEGADNGVIYLRDTLTLTGFELNAELRRKQAQKSIEMCRCFLAKITEIHPVVQSGIESFYPKRTAADSRLDPDKSLREQFNLLRIVSNDEYPAFFDIGGHRYILKIEEALAL